MLILALFCAYPMCHAQNKTGQVEAAKGLITRLIPSHARFFDVAIIPQQNGKDVFTLEQRNGKILLSGSNGVSVASALNYYLKNFTYCDISWNGNNLNLPKVLPAIGSKIEKVTFFDRRYYLNYCTFNYTMSWWGWERWEKEIDFMALNGINMPLAVTGQEAIWDRVYKKMGFTDADLESFYSGPAYLNWNYMGNLDGWGGPLPKSWMESHEVLQKKILERERALGMTPVLPAFTGHVPPSFNKVFPEVKLKTTQWVNFAPVNIIDPSEEMFTTIGRKFMEEQTAAYGTDHLYSADTFNENVPPTPDSTYLSEMSKKVYQSMAAYDPEAIWVMQAWMFSHNDDFWKPTQIKALLNAIPNDKMIVLDLYSETYPIWNKSESYYGKPWIWNMLHNFGGNIGMFGRMEPVVNGPSKVVKDPKKGNLVGIGLTPEGLEQNPVIYQLMMDNIWNTETIDLKAWLDNYALRRYGKKNVDAEEAWQVLRKTAYSGGKSSGTPKGIVSARPTFNSSTRQIIPHKAYQDKDFIVAWDKLIKASADLKKSEGFQYDLVDVTRQALANYGDVLQRKFAADYKNKDLANFEKRSTAFLNLISDMDQLLATRKDFLLGTWLNSAKGWGTTPAEKKLYEKNARNLITVWGDTTCRLNDYAARQWSGMLSGFYKPRWQQFINLSTQALKANKEVNLQAFENTIRRWEWNWVNSNEVYKDSTVGDPIQVANMLYTKYRKQIEENL
jgi:alpha-N-acetylglucosaminidase